MGQVVGHAKVNGHGQANGHMQPERVPVLIVGAGPVGLLSAYLLAKQNIASLVIEKYPTRLASPKAHALSPRSLEICRQIGLSIPRIRQLATPRTEGSHVRFVSTVGGDQIGYLPYERQDVDVLKVTSEMITNIAQPTFERMLVEEHLAGDPNVEIRRGVEFIKTTEHSDGSLTTRVRERDGGKEYDIESQYLIGCDGANSKVRQSLGISTTGEDAFDHMITITFSADLTKINGGRHGILYWVFNPSANGFIINYDARGLQAMNHPYNPATEPASTFTTERCTKIIREALGVDADFKVIAHLPWTLQRRVADSYSRGNVFLAGDSAHSFPPTGGLGLNTGMADIHALSWRLGMVYRGQASRSIFDLYHTERQPVALNNGLHSVKNGKTILKLLRLLSTEYDTTDPARARQIMHERLADPDLKAQIDVEVVGQREHFDCLGLQIGYSYTDTRPPADASVFVPKFEVGARLPHAWIRVPENSALRTQGVLPPPVDLSYLDQQPEGADDMRYSTLDMVPANTWAVICAPKTARTALRSRIVVPPGMPVTFVVAGQDFAEVDPANGWQGQFGLLDGTVAAVVVRPDQHVCAIVSDETGIETALKSQVGQCRHGEESACRNDTDSS